MIDERNSRRALEREAESNRMVALRAVEKMQEAMKQVQRMAETINDHIMIPKIGQPKGATFVEAYISERNTLIVLGDPRDSSHNCDEMGCSSVCHVLYRIDLEKLHNQSKD